MTHELTHGAEAPWRRPLEVLIGLVMFTTGALILVAGPEWAPAYLARSGAVTVYAYGTMCLAGGAATVTGSVMLWRARTAMQRITARTISATGLLPIALVTSSYALTTATGPLSSPRSSMLILVLAAIAVACLLRAVVLMRDNSRTRALVRQAVTDLTTEGDGNDG